MSTSGSFTPFTVRAPGSTANFGSAFDAVGMALDLWLEIRVESATENGIVMLGEGADSIENDADDNVVFQAARLGATAVNADLPPLHISATNGIPLARGLGSSAAAVAAGLLIAGIVTGRERELPDVLADATHLEGHPDNVAPSLMGGVCLAVIAEDELPVARQLEFPNELDCIAFVPDEELSTAQARAALPRKVPLRDATFNLARTALLVQTFTSRRWDDLGLATEDRLHQPYRSELVPGLAPLTRAAKDAGAYTAFLSGAGPTIMAMTSSGRSQAVANAMQTAADERGIAGRVLRLSPSPQGAHVVAESA